MHDEAARGIWAFSVGESRSSVKELDEMPFRRSRHRRRNSLRGKNASIRLTNSTNEQQSTPSRVARGKASL